MTTTALVNKLKAEYNTDTATWCHIYLDKSFKACEELVSEFKGKYCFGD